MDSKEALAILDSIQSRIGNDEEIDSVTADLVSLKIFVEEVDTTIDLLNEDLAKTNEKNRSLLQANNTLYRQIGLQKEAMDKASEQVSSSSAIAKLI